MGPTRERHSQVRAAGYVWAPRPNDPVALADTQEERIRLHARALGWTLVDRIRAVRSPALRELVERVVDAHCDCVVMAAETLATLEHQYPEIWRLVQARFEARGISIVKA